MMARGHVSAGHIVSRFGRMTAFDRARSHTLRGAEKQRHDQQGRELKLHPSHLSRS